MTTREQEIRHYVATEKNHFWEAYDQGRWAHTIGVMRDGNPHIPGHINANDWQRGWDFEAAR